MKMNFLSGIIILDEPRAVYYSGQVIFGKLEFKLDKPVDISDIQLQCFGTAKVLWTESHVVEYNQVSRQVEEKFTGKEEYFNVVQTLVGGQGVFRIRSGNHSIPFQYQIPLTAPSSFKGEMGSIEYRILAYMDYSDPLVPRECIEKHFDVVAPFDLNCGAAEIRRPIEIEFEEMYTCCLFSSDPVYISVRLPVSGYCPGQTMPLLITAKNDSNFEIRKIVLKLTKKERYRSQHPISEYAPEEEVLTQIKKGPVMSNSKREFKVGLVVPDMIAPNLEHCHIIDVAFFIKVIIKMSGFYDDLQDESEICLGLFPLSEYANGYRHPMQDSLPTGSLPDPHSPVKASIQIGPNVIETLSKDTTEPVKTVPPYPDKAAPPYPASAAPPYPASASPPYSASAVSSYPASAAPPYPASAAPLYPASAAPPYPASAAPPYPASSVSSYPDSAVSPYPASAAPPYPVENVQKGGEVNEFDGKKRYRPVSGQAGFNVVTSSGFAESTASYPVSKEFKTNYYVHESITSSVKSVPYSAGTINNPPYPPNLNIPISNEPKPSPVKECEIGFKAQLMNPPYPIEDKDPMPTIAPTCPYPTDNKMPSLPNLTESKSPYYMSDLARRPKSQDCHINLPLTPPRFDPNAPSAPPSSP